MFRVKIGAYLALLILLLSPVYPVTAQNIENPNRLIAGARILKESDEVEIWVGMTNLPKYTCLTFRSVELTFYDNNGFVGRRNVHVNRDFARKANNQTEIFNISNPFQSATRVESTFELETRDCGLHQVPTNTPIWARPIELLINLFGTREKTKMPDWEVNVWKIPDEYVRDN